MDAEERRSPALLDPSCKAFVSHKSIRNIKYTDFPDQTDSGSHFATPPILAQSGFVSDEKSK